MKKILTLGNGFIAAHLPYEKIKDRIYLDDEYVYGIINKYKPDVLINTIGYGGKPNIDACELNKVKTYETNTLIPGLLASACEKLSIHFIHMGSGCIFNGKSPNVDVYGIPGSNKDSGWNELDLANPASYYGKTKYAADLMIGDMKNVSILRLRMPISPLNNPRNLLNKLLGYKDIVEELNSVTFTDDLPIIIDYIINKEAFGIYNCTSRVPIKHSDLLEEYKKYVPDFTYNKITTKELDELTVAKRSNAILNNSKLYWKCFNIADTAVNIRKTIKQFVENRQKETQ
jgi:dTDP-4-dehydrorhamnose reductase